MSSLECKTCHESKPSSDFYKRKSKRGFQYNCKECAKAYRKRLTIERRAGKRGHIERDAKVCYACKVEKPVAEFHHHAGSPDGYGGRCISCWKNLSPVEAEARKKHASEWKRNNRPRWNFYMRAYQRERRRIKNARTI